MQGGPGDEILKELEAGTADDLILKKYKLNSDQLHNFKSLRYGLKNNELKQEQIKDYFPELNDFFATPAGPVAPAGAPQPGMQPTTVPAEQLAQPAAPQEFDLLGTAKKRKELQSKLTTMEEEGRQGKTGGITDPYKLQELEGYRKSIAGMDEEAKAAGYETKVLDELADIPEGEGFSLERSIPEIVKIRDTNPLLYDRTLNAVKAKGELFNAIRDNKDTKTAGEFMRGLQEVEGGEEGDYRKATRMAMGAVYENVHDGEQQQKIIAKIKNDKYYDYGVRGMQDGWDERLPGLNPYQTTYLHFLEDTDPGQFEALSQKLLTNPDDMWMGSNEQSIRKGYEQKAKEAEVAGMTMMRKAYEEKLTAYKNKLEKRGSLSPEEMQDAQKVNEDYQTLLKDMEGQAERYPLAQIKEANQVIQDLYGSEYNQGESFLQGVTHNLIDKPLDFIERVVGGADTIDDLEKLGDQDYTDMVQWKTPEGESEEREYNTTVTPALKKKLDDIWADEKLSEEEKRQKMQGLVVQNPSQIGYEKNPNAGNINLTGKSILNRINSTASQLLPQLALAYMTGGTANASQIQQLSSLFGSTMAISNQDYYLEAIQKNIKNPGEYAFAHSIIEAASELPFNNLKQLKEVFGNSKVAKILDGVSEEEFKAIAKAGKGRFKNVADSFLKTLKVSNKTGLEESAEEVAGNIGHNVANKELFDRDEGSVMDGSLKSFVNTYIGMAPLGLLGGYSQHRNTNLQAKYSLFEAAANPTDYLAQLKGQEASGQIDPKEAARIKTNILRAAAILPTIPQQNLKGQNLTDNQKAEYLYNEVAKSDIKEQSKNVPGAIAEKMKEEETKLDDANAKILTEKIKTEKAPVKEPEEVKEVINETEKTEAAETVRVPEEQPASVAEEAKPVTEEAKPAPVKKKAKPQTEQPAAQTEESKAFRDHVIETIPVVKSSDFDFRIDIPDMQQSERERAVTALKAGKTNAATKRLEAAINEMVAKGAVPLIRGKSRTEIPLSEYMAEINKPAQEQELDLDTPEKISEELAKLFEDPIAKSDIKTEAKTAEQAAPEKIEVGATITGEHAGQPVTGKVIEMLDDGRVKIKNSKGTVYRIKPTEPGKTGNAVDKLDKSLMQGGNNRAADNTTDEYLTKAKSVLEQLYPNIAINVYDSEADYLKSTGRPRGSIASFNQGKNAISYNLEGIKRANAPTTVFHEIIHPIVEEAMNKNDDALRDLYSSLEKLKDEPGMQEVFEYMDAYRDRGGKVQKVEAVTEFLTQVASGNLDVSKLPEQTMTKIIDFINKLLKAIGIEKQISTAHDLRRLADTITEALTTSDASGLRELLGAPSLTKKDSVFDAFRPVKNKEEGIKAIIKRTPKSVSDDKLHDIIMKSQPELDPVQVTAWIDEIRNPPIPPKTPFTTADLAPEERNLSLKKFENATKETKEAKPSWFKTFWNNLSNASAWIENPYRFITKITEDISKEYKIPKRDAIPLGRAFEKNASGRAALKVQQFVNEVLLGKIGDEKLGRIKGEELKDFAKYLMAKRVIDRLDTQKKKRTDGENVSRQTGNITTQDAEVQLQELEKKYGAENIADFEKRAQAFQENMDTMLKTIQAAGIISQETYDQIKEDNDFYAPFSIVQEKILADQDTQPVGISGVIKRIKGIGFVLPHSIEDATDFMNELAEAVNTEQISPEEYFHTAYQTLTNLKNAGTISQEKFDNWISHLENPGFKIQNIIDAAANMIYRAEGMALKNTMMQRLYSFKQYDKEGKFIQDVEGFEPVTVGGETRMVPKPLNKIPVNEGMAPIRLRIDGDVKTVAVNKEAAKKLNEMNNYETHWMLKGLDVINRIFRAFVITVSPGFQIANVLIDFVRTTMLSRYGLLAGKGLVQPLVNAVLYVPQYIEALGHSILGNVGAKTDTFKQWMNSDSFSKGMFDNLFDNEKKVKEITASNGKRILELFTKLKIFSLLEIPGSILEQTHKLAIHQRGQAVEGLKPEMFTAMLSGLFNSVVTENMTKDELKDAVDRLNYEVQNFAGSPNFPQTHKWLKIASIFLQFFSARVKGEMTDYRRVANLFSGKGEGVKLSAQERTQMLLQFGGMASVIAAYAIMNNLDDDDEAQFNSIPSHARDNNLNIPSGEFVFEFEDGSRETLRDYIKIPMRGLTATMNVTANSSVKFYKRQEGKEFKKAFLNFLSNSSPVNLHGDDTRQKGESLVSNLTPVFKYFMEYSFNKNTHTHRQIIPDQYGDNSMLKQFKAWTDSDLPIEDRPGIPPWEVAVKQTPDWAKWLSKFLYDTMGIEAAAITLDHMENTMGNPSELTDNPVQKRLRRSKMKYPVQGASGHVVEEADEEEFELEEEEE